MRRSTRRSCQVAALSVIALLAAGCASVPPSADPGPSPTSKFITSGPATPLSTPTASAPGATSPSEAPSPGHHGHSHGHGGGHGTNPFASLASAYSSNVTAAVYDANTGKTYVLHPGVQEQTASIVKVEIMGTLLKQAQDAGSPLPGTELSLMTSMIEASDNSSATMLYSDAGGPSKVKQFDEAVGMTATEPHATTPYIDGDPNLPAWGQTLTTATDEVKLVRAFAYGPSVLNSTSRHYGISLMSHVEADQDWGVSGGVAPGTSVALKNGWLPLNVASNSDWQVNSIGWIHGDGRDYVLAVLTTGNASEQAGIDTISHISEIVYRTLG
jgi:Beta-lactamase enzyme family